ncbi:Outer membrane usher protein HtrE precursor [Amantichitinum ursilacus]|uniref:Outer membrane usher protein HtrE n=2 Tax=Amantichitinum ursilacus TaxID=857265 RepID=A0A0N1JTH6_9NEIS|nr:Outer membrane usher protein HtrE precursor [Amantichitinum ursilacus]
MLSALMANSAVVLAEQSIEFDEDMLVGKSIPRGGLARFAKTDRAAPGVYEVDVFIERRFVQRAAVVFQLMPDDEIAPCLSADLLHAAGVQLSAAAMPSAACRPLADWAPGATAKFDSARLRLDLAVPQALLARQHTGAVSLAELDAGVPVLFANYDASAWWAQSAQNNAPSLFATVQTGANAGLWQLRQQSSFNAAGNSGGVRWHADRTWLQRPLPAWRSQLLVGDAPTPGHLFGSVMVRGVQMVTDDRMLPDGLRGYAPVVRGVATSNARVSIRQGDVLLYQTTVSPGAFVIDDLYPAGINGDLGVEVAEADGQVQRFTMPYVALPQSLRPGQQRVAWAAGRVADVPNTALAQLDWQAGINNMLTANAGVRGASGYAAGAGGVVLATALGAFGFDVLLARSRGHSASWQWAGRWSQRLAGADTNVGLEWLQRSPGCLDLTASIRTYADRCTGATRQLGVTGNQPLGRWGQLYVSALLRRGDEAPTQDYQLSYSVAVSGLSLTAMLSRQRRSAQSGMRGTQGNTALLSVSGNWGEQRTVGASLTRQSGSDMSTISQLQTTLSGTLGTRASYGIAATQARQGNTALDVSLQQNLAAVTLGASAALGKSHRQAGLSARGAVVAHAGGVTTGPWLSDTFGLVEAPGAAGADVRDGSGATIDGAGYALITALQPYRYNDVTLGTQALDAATELLSSQQRVAPYAGAVPRLRFKTRRGRAVLLRLARDDGQPLPFGADVYGPDAQLLGLVGQQSQLYARVAEDVTELSVQWGDQPGARCRVQLPAASSEASRAGMPSATLCRMATGAAAR